MYDSKIDPKMSEVRGRSLSQFITELYTQASVIHTGSEYVDITSSFLHNKTYVSQSFGNL